MPRRRLDPTARSRGQRLAARISAARKSTGLSAEAIAHAAGISVETLRSIERARTLTPEFFTVAHLAKTLGLSLDGLYEELAAQQEHEGDNTPNAVDPPTSGSEGDSPRSTPHGRE